MTATNDLNTSLGEGAKSPPYLANEVKALYTVSSFALVIWGLLLAGSLFWAIHTSQHHMQEMAHNAAHAHFNKDQAFRLWGASHGGVYVPISEHTQPNPYLSHVPERDFETPSGKKLTLMNPAYMVRQLMNDFAGLYNIRGRITSLKPLNPLNSPDEWEIKALKAFDKGAKEYAEFIDIDGEPFLRLMQPMITKEPCLKCHAQQGYKIGNVRGGVGISVPYAPYLKVYQDQIRNITISHLAIGVLGLFAILMLSFKEKQRISERLTMMKALHDSEEQWRSITETSPDYIIKLDSDLTVQFINRTEPGLTIADVIGKPLYLLAPEEQQASVKQSLHLAFSDKSPVKYETSYSRPDGKVIYFESVASPVYQQNQVCGLTVSSRDVTERKVSEKGKKDLELRLRQAQKMEAIGSLAGGIAHDFNNILGVILGYTELAKDDAPSGSKCNNDLDKIYAAAKRARDLVAQILAFSRQSQKERYPLQIQPLVKECLKMLRASIPSTISIVEEIAPKGGSILADPTQIHQILMNLCTNAYHAMESTGGVLTISVKTVFISADKQDILHVKPGEFIELSVSDTGTGIGPDILERIFDPYFTTKEVGKGTGMGLAIIHGIISEYGGAIEVESALGRGSTFHVFFPVVKGDTLPDESEKDETPQGRERILFIDDEEILTELGKDMLERLGYRVTTRHTSIEALSTFQNSPDDFDLVITDQTMPDITGTDLARRMMQIRPDIPIILCTGYSNLIDEDSVKSLGIKEFVLKPLIKGTLSKLIRKVLDV